ncbi:MAG: hypothetical protein HRT68_00100 [Flavobacteriaceae bacterium]|nr:hypothetical protein [Flavobacteriaceae bacterium]
MKKRILTFLFICLAHIAISQTFEVGLFGGGSNFVGDVGSTSYIAPNDFAIGGIFKWNRSERHAFRFSFIYANINGEDSASDDPRRIERDYSFNNTIKEFSLGIEFTFLDYDVYDGRRKTTPYLFTGINYFNYDLLARNSFNNDIEKYDSDWEFAIPMVVGIKTNISRTISIGFEIGARYSLTDALDGSNPIGELEDDLSRKFGNLDSDDWYFFTGFTATYTFGDKPCFCVF